MSTQTLLDLLEVPQNKRNASRTHQRLDVRALIALLQGAIAYISGEVMRSALGGVNLLDVDEHAPRQNLYWDAARRLCQTNTGIPKIRRIRP